MYEIRQQQRKELREQKWFYYLILAIGIFIYSQGCSSMSISAGYAAAGVILGLIMHNASVGKLFKRIFGYDFHKKANIAMIIFLCLLALTSYFKRLGFIFYVLLDFTSIILFTILSLIYSYSKKH